MKTELDDFLDFMDPSNQSDHLDDIELEPNKLNAGIIPSFHSLQPSFRSSVDSKDWTDSLLDLNFDPEKNDTISEDQTFTPRVIQVTNFQNTDVREDRIFDNIKKEMPSEEEEDEPYETKYVCKKSLFKVSVAPAKPPWEVDEEDDENTGECEDFAGDKNIEMMSEYEENETYKKLKAIIAAADSTKQGEVPAWIRRHYRKLSVRRSQRSLGKPVFDIDNLKKTRRLGKQSVEGAVVLDRYHHLTASSSGADLARSLHARLAGSYHYEMFVSPHTGRVLHPFIYRNDQCVPPWVKLMCELQLTVNDEMPSRASVDFCYVRPQHIAAVNALLQRLFWPGIDSK